MFDGGLLVGGGVLFKNGIGLDLHGNLRGYAVAAEAAGIDNNNSSDQTAGSIQGVLIIN
jgi:hypothetical protein